MKMRLAIWANISIGLLLLLDFATVSTITPIFIKEYGSDLGGIGIVGYFFLILAREAGFTNIGAFIFSLVAGLHGLWIVPLVIAYFLSSKRKANITPDIEVSETKNYTLQRGVVQFLRTHFSTTVAACLILIAVGNYLYTFNGFVAETQNERRACLLYKQATMAMETGGDNNAIEFYHKLSSVDKDVLNDYMQLISHANRHCKTIHQFYIEEIGLIIALLALSYLSSRGHKFSRSTRSS